LDANPDDQNDFYLELDLYQYQSEYQQDQTNLSGLQSQLSFFMGEQSSIMSDEVGIQGNIFSVQSQLSSAQIQLAADQYEVSQLQDAANEQSETLNLLAAELQSFCGMSVPGVDTLGLEATATDTRTVTASPGGPASTAPTRSQTVTAPSRP